MESSKSRRHQSSASLDTTPAAASKPKALLADDDPAQCVLMSQALSDAGYAVTVAHDGGEAIRQAGEDRPDIIFLDVMMPGISGLEACRKISQQLGDSCPPIIVVTSCDSDEEIATGFDAGASDYLIKPVNWTLFRHRIRGWLAAHAAATRASVDGQKTERHLMVSRRGEVLSDSAADSAAATTATGAQLLRDCLSPDFADALMVCLRKVLKSREPANICFDDKEANVAAAGRDRVSIVVTTLAAQRSSELELYRLAYLDSATGLPNRHLFERTAKAALADAQLRSQHLTLLCITFDELTAPDHQDSETTRALRAIAERLATQLRSGDSLVRYDLPKGDVSPIASLDSVYFLLLLNDLSSSEATAAVVERIRAACARASRDEKALISLTPRIGLARFPDDSQDVANLIRLAILAAGEARAQRASEPRLLGADLAMPAHVRADLAGELEHALAAQQLSLYYQPRVCVATGQVLGAEALLRWHDPLRGPIVAAELLDMAETVGLAATVTDWSLREALRQVSVWSERLGVRVPISVNIDAAQLGCNFSHNLAEAIFEFGVDPSWIEIEVPEACLDINESVTRQLLELRAAGVGLIIDDFGEGNASLAILRRLKIDGFKVNHGRQSGRKIDDQSDIYRLAGSIAQARHASLIAKSIESAEEFEFARRAGCDQAQGFHVCQPLSAGDFERYVAEAQAIKRAI